MPSTTWDLVVTQYQTLARDAMTDDEYKRSKAWIAWVDEPATSPQKERLFEVAEANSDALLHEFYVLQRTTPEDKELNPDDYQQQMAVFNNELRTRIAAYEKGVNLSGRSQAASLFLFFHDRYLCQGRDNGRGAKGRARCRGRLSILRGQGSTSLLV